MPPAAAAARRIALGFGLREIGLASLAVILLSAGGVWWHRNRAQEKRDLDAIRVELATRGDSLEFYQQRIAALDWQANQIRAWADAQQEEPERTWARERSHRFDAFVQALRHDQETHVFEQMAHEIEGLAADGNLAGARAKLHELPVVRFPTGPDFERLRRHEYDEPLANFSRQSPDFYRAFQSAEPEAARADAQALRKEIVAAAGEPVTPQLMMKVDLLSAVAPHDDPVVAEWSALASALDYFESPDGETLMRWRRAQRAIQANDWGAASSEMQAILKSTVRTRQPFRAALGRALLHRNPDQPEAAYPFLAEAAGAGDKKARLWVAQEDFKQKRFASAQRWLEAAVADGDTDAVPTLIELYDKHGDAIAFNPADEIGVVQRVTDRPDAPAAAWLLQGRLYEARDPSSASRNKAYACYRRAAASGSAQGSAEVARCALNGIGTAPDLETARDEACRAFARGEREKSVPVLIELMRRAPDRAAGAIEKLFESEQLTGGGGYMETRVVFGPGVSQLKGMVARYLDQAGRLGEAVRFYAGSRDPAAVQRRGELTAVHPCETCGGTGKIQINAPCPTCGGKGKQICSFCGGTGFIFVPGTPPCLTCGGTGTIMQDRRLVTCGACGGTGKGKGNVIKQDCSHCDHGYVACLECGGTGTIKVPKECPECHGHGFWTLADRGSGE